MKHTFKVKFSAAPPLRGEEPKQKTRQLKPLLFHKKKQPTETTGIKTMLEPSHYIIQQSMSYAVAAGKTSDKRWLP
jgi:hypothetical protein